MKNCAVTILVAVLLILPLHVALGDTSGEVGNIVYMTESEESGELAETVANLIIAHGLGDSFQSIFIIDNLEDKDLFPIMVLKLSKKGESLPIKGDENLEKMIDEVAFLIANRYKGRKTFVYIQDTEHSNLLEANYDPEEKGVIKKARESE